MTPTTLCAYCDFGLSLELLRPTDPLHSDCRNIVESYIRLGGGKRPWDRPNFQQIPARGNHEARKVWRRFWAGDD